jgi:hypothetical protein
MKFTIVLTLLLTLLIVSSFCLNGGFINNHGQQQALAQNVMANQIQVPKKPVTFLTYQSTPYRIKMMYPSDWRLSRSLPHYTTIATFVSPLENVRDPLPVTFRISVVNYVSNITTNEYTNSVLNSSKALGSQVRIVESKPITLSGMPAYILSIIPNANQPIKFAFMSEWTVKGHNVYLLTYTAPITKFSKYLPTVQKMLASVQIT